MVKGEDIVQPGIPESFNVLVKELQSLGLSVELLNETENNSIDLEEDMVIEPIELSNGSGIDSELVEEKSGVDED